MAHGVLGRRSLLLGLLALTALPARGAEVLRYAGDAAFHPFEWLDEQGRPQGFQVELLRELGPLIGVSFTVTLQPWAASEAALRGGQADLVAMVQTAERQGWADFADGHATPAIAVYRRQLDPDPQDLAALVERRVAVPEGEPMRDTLNTWLAQLRGPFVMRATPEQVLAAVARGEADLALLPRAYADPLLARGVAAGVVASPLVLRVQNYGFAVAPGNEALRGRLEAGLHALERSGRLEALRVKWLSSHRDVAERERLAQGLSRQKALTWGLASAAGLGLLALGGVSLRRGQQLLAERRQRRQAEAALQQAEHVLDRSFTLNPEPMLLIERAGGRVRDTNAALQTLLGVPARHTVGQRLEELGAHIDALTLERLEQALDCDGALDAAPLTITSADGQTHSCLVSAAGLSIGGVDHVFCIVRDVSAQLTRDAELQTAYDALVSELARTREALDGAARRTALAERSLQDFTGAVAHDLRAPLLAMQGFTGLLRERLKDGLLHEAVEYTEHIARATQRMNTMVNALTGLAQVSRHPLQRQTVPMGQMARETWNMLSASQARRVVDFRIEDDLPDTRADPELTAHVWQNLLHNAWKYSARVPNAKVAVTSLRDERGLWYRVTDNGAGFDMTRAHQLFQPFQRLHSGSDFEGSGIGLSLVRRIVEHHGGEIRLRSAPGVGTVAEFTLDPHA